MWLATGLHERQCGLIVTGFTSEVHSARLTKVLEEEAPNLDPLHGPTKNCAVVKVMARSSRHPAS